MRLAAALALTLAAGPAAADLSADIAANGLAATEAALAGASSDADRMALAGVRFLRGVERALQTRWTHGIAAERTEIPVLRLPIPPNPAPAPFTPAVIPAMFAALQADMEGTRAALTPLPDGDWGVTLRLGDLWFDIDGNGARGRGEGLIEVAGRALAGLGRVERAPRGVAVRFDAADAAWLLAYTHLLTAVTNAALAYDLETAIAGVAANRARLDAIYTAGQPVNALNALFGTQADRLLVLWRMLAQTPDAARAQAVRADILAMVAANRTFWTRVAAETDDADEWVPNEAQTSALGIALPPGTADAWQAVLADAEALMTGARLMPHWRLGGGAGINLARFLDAPAPIDPVEWAHGAGALPWAEPGPRVTPESWQAFARLVRGDTLMFVLFLN